jgi:putative oxidoreductase
MRSNQLIFATSGADTAAGDAGLAVLRVAAGFLLMFLHGLGKVPPSDGFVSMVGQMGMPAPQLFAWLAAFTEVGAAILLAVGLLTRPAAALLVVHFVVVVLLAHAGDALGDRELPILFGVIALCVALTGPGRFSIDALIAGRRTY